MASSAPSPEPVERGHLILVGMMGVGKTTVGRKVARRLGRPFIDSDEQVKARTGATVAQIFERDGEARFRRLESEALAEALTLPIPAVVAAAGGVVLNPENRRRLREAGHVVWLRADPATLVIRVESARASADDKGGKGDKGDNRGDNDDDKDDNGGDHRPLLGDDPLGVLTRLDRERHHLYAEVADEVIDVAERTSDEVIELIVARLAR